MTKDGAALDEHSIPGNAEVVVLTMFQSHCGPCIAEQEVLQRLRQTHGERLRVVVLGLEGPRGYWNYVTENGLGELEYVRTESEPSVRKDFQVFGIPLTLVVDRRSRIAYRHEGFGHKTESELANEVDALLNGDAERAAR